jgi:integrase
MLASATMGSVAPYESAAGKRYRVRYRTPDHQERQKRGFRTKREAELYLASVEVQKARGEFIDARHAQALLGTLGDAWMASQAHLKPSSLVVMESAWRLHVKPVWGGKRLNEIRHSDVQRWVSSLSTKKSPALVHRSYGILANILDTAVRDRLLAANPARGVPLPRKIGKEHRFLTHQQVHDLAEACEPHDTLILTLAYTGLRWGEATGLRVKDVDLVRNRLNVNVNAVRVGQDVIVGTPKPHERRSVPFPAFLQPRLASATAGRAADDLVFPDQYGHHLITPTIKYNSWWDKALVAVGLPPMTIHDLRHTAASLAVSSGANVKAVQKLLGHKSAAMTLDTYADLFDDDLDDVADRLNQVVADSNVAKLWPQTKNKAPKSDD